MSNNLQEAAIEYLARRDRKKHPQGRKDRAGRWYPSGFEHCECCDYVRNPTRGYPWSLMHHCRSTVHIAKLFNVDIKELRKEIRTIEQPDRPTNHTYFKLVADVDGRLLSIYDGATEYRMLEKTISKINGYHDGGIYCYREVQEALDAIFPKSSKLLKAKKIILGLRVFGKCKVYNINANPILGNAKKYSFSTVTPISMRNVIENYDNEGNCNRQIA